MSKISSTGTLRAQVAIRADASDRIGVGHVMRCASLGFRLMAEGRKVHFIVAEIDEWLSVWLRKKGFGLSILPLECVGNSQLDAYFSSLVLENLENCSWVVVDHYGLESKWEKVMRNQNKRILVIDDVGIHEHSCDVLLSTSPQETESKSWSSQGSDVKLTLIGPSFMILRPEFDSPSLKRFRSGSIERILVYLGGGDVYNEIRKVTSAIQSSTSKNLDVTVVLGRTQIPIGLVDELLFISPDLKIISNSQDMAILISEADLAIGTCGVSAWERCSLGLPALTVTTADNQVLDAMYLDRLGAVKNLGVAKEVDTSTWSREISTLLNDRTRVSQMSIACLDSAVAQRDSTKKLMAVFD